MVRKKLAVAILAFSALQADLAGALGLGNLTVKSALNQPLNAEIRLLDAGELDASQVRIQLAPPEDFQRAGVDRDFFLTNLRFNVELDGRGGGVIRVTTREPVVEPYLNFVLETRWPTGRLLREFAMLLDPPTFSANGPAAVNPAASGGASAPRPTRRVEPPRVTSEPAAAPAPVSNSLPEATNSGEYRIQVSDTLSKIASRHKPAGDVTLQQAMVAIQRANPEVFIRNNINLIKSGYVLRLPTADEARAVSVGEAAQVVQEQTRHWRNGGASGAAAPASGPQLDASSRAQDPQDEPREQARLSIAAPGNADKGGSGEGKGGAKGTEALRNQLTTAQESLEKGQRENKELQSRLDDMERQIATLQRLISLKDDQLAALQAKGAEGNAAKPAAESAIAPAGTETPAADTPAPASAETAPVQAAATETAPAPAKPAAPKPAHKPVAPQPAPEAPGLLEQLSANPLYAAGGLGALALLGGLLVMRRRRAAAEELEALADLEAAEENLNFDDDFELENVRVSDDAVIHPDAAEAAQAAAQSASERQPLRSETGDAIAEADIYIAYGRYPQAVDLLSAAIDNEPVRSDLRVKLLEVYLEMRDRESFRRQYSALQGLGDANALTQIREMLSSVDGVSDWLGESAQPGNTEAAFAAAAGTALATTVALASAEAEPEPAGGEEPDLDLALAASEAQPADPADELVFDLDLDEPEPELVVTERELSDLALDLDITPDVDSLDLAEADAPIEQFSFEAPVSLETSLELEPELTDLAGAESLLEGGLDTLAGLPEAEGLELDLEEDDLDLALSELDGSGELEDLAAAISDSADAPLVTPERDFTAELDDLGADFDLGADLSAPVATPPQLDELADLEALDDLGDLGEELEVVAEEPSEAAEEFDFLADADEVSTKLDLARAYIDMGDTDGAKDILDEVLQEGNDGQKQEASVLLARIA